MAKWNFSLIVGFLILSLLANRIIFNPPTPSRPRVLAEEDVLNWATIATPTPTPTPTSGPSATPTPTLAPGQPTPTPTPTRALTPMTASTPTPTPTPRSGPSPTSSPIAPKPTPTPPPEEYFSYSLFGYTSSYANVRLEGIKLLEGTKANQSGYFEFNGFMASNQNKEFCLVTIDTENLVAPPLCIPVPLPEAGRRFGPYLLPPTLRLSKGEVTTGEITTASGKTIPGAALNLYVFKKEESGLAALFIKPAFAATENQRPLTIKLNPAADGSYSTRVESNQSGKRRLFSQSVFSTQSGKNRTPKSITLTINIFNVLMALLITIFAYLTKFLTLNVLLLIQLLAIVFVLVKRRGALSWYHCQAKKTRAMVLYHTNSLALASTRNFTPLKLRAELY